MSSNNFRYLKHFILFLLLFLTFACKRTKEIEKVDYSSLKNKEIVEKIREKAYDFTHLAGKAKVDAMYQNKTYSFTTHIRWKFDETIWMSFTMFGIEGYRLLIQPDSFKMIDRLNNQYMVKPFSHFQELAKMDISFNDIQVMLMGQMLFSQTKKPDIEKGKNEISLMVKDDRFLNLTKLEIMNGNIISQFVQDNEAGRKMTIHQSNYHTDASGKFPLKRDITIAATNEFINVKMDFNKIKSEINQEYPFDVPPKFRKVE